MKIHSNGRKWLAIVCALAMLASLMVSFGITASAAATELGSWGAETTNGSGVDWAQSSNHTTQSDRPMSIVDKGAEAKEGSKVIVAKYPNNANDVCYASTESDGTMQLPAGGRVGMFGNDNNKISSNSWYRITFYYRVANMPTGTGAEIKFIIASRNWSSGNYNAKIKGAFTAATIPAGASDEGWIAAAGYVKVSAGEGFHITLAPVDNTQRGGMEIWLDDIHVYKVNTASDRINLTVNANDDVTADTTQWGYAGDPLSSLPVLTRDNYTFDGWYDAAEGGNKVTAWPSSAKTIYAHWKKDMAATCTVTCNAVGIGTTVVSAAPGTNISSKVATPTRAGYIFDGWFSEPACVNRVTVVPASDITLYAGWTAQTSIIEDFEDYGKTPSSLLDLNFESDTAPTYYNGNNRTANHSDADVSLVDVGGNTVMQMCYLGGKTPVTTRCGFRLTDNAGKGISAKSGTVYRVTFKYKIVNAPMQGSIAILNASLNWAGNGEPNANMGAYVAEDMVSFPMDTTTDWITASYVFQANNNNGLHIALHMDKTTARGGAVVYIDDVNVSTNAKSEADFIRYGTASVTTEQNRTAGGVRAAKLTANSNPTEQTARVVFSNKVGKVPLTVGKKYVATAWVYSPTAVTGAKVRFINDYDLANMATAYTGKLQGEVTLDLPAGEWVRVQKFFTLNAINGETEAYLSAGVCVPGSATVYLDDLSLQEYVADMTMVTGYEQFDAITYPAGTEDGVNGNDAGRTVSMAQNHTTGGDRSLALGVNGASAAKAARTVVFIDRENFRATVGQGYVVSFWAFSETATDMHFAVGSTGDLTVTNAAVQKDIEGDSEKTVSLAAGEWKQVNLLASQITGAGGATDPYLTINAWSDGASATNVKTVYVDDVRIVEYAEYTMNPEIQSFEDTPIDADISLNKGIFASLDANHTEGGILSAKVIAKTNAGGTRPQMIVTTGDGDQISIEAGKKYEVTFWAYTNDANVNLLYWFAATDSATAFTSTSEKDASKIYEPGSGTVLTQGTWKQFSITITSAAYSGLLRMGVAANSASSLNPQTIYIDDIQVKKIKNIVYDPDATVQDFENFQLGDGMGTQGDKKFIFNGDGEISRKVNHTPGTGNEQALLLKTKSHAGVDRNQFLLIDPKNGNFLELEKDVGYTISFWVYMSSDDADPDSASTMAVNFWLMTTDKIAKISDKSKAEYDVAGSTEIDCDQWVQFSVSIVPKYGRYVMMGITDSTKIYAESQYYIDDITVEKAKYVTYKYDTNGSEDVIPDTIGIVGEIIPLASRPETYPYREGYEFTGWYFNKDCTPDSLFDMEEDKVQGNDGDVITLYAGWAAWKSQSSDIGTKKKEPELVYKNQTVYDRVWIGDDVEDPVIESGDRPEVEATDPVNVSPRKDKKNAEDGVATWLIIVIAAAAVVVVGGGAALTLILLKKSKTKA